MSGQVTVMSENHYCIFLLLAIVPIHIVDLVTAYLMRCLCKNRNFKFESSIFQNMLHFAHVD